MLDQLRARLRRKFNRHVTNRKDRPPPYYDCIRPDPRALTPLALRDPAWAAGYNASLEASAITARAIAEGRNKAKALEMALHRIHSVVPEVIRSYGVEHDHHLVESIWANAISASAATAGEISRSRNRSYAIKRARWTEAWVADGSADAMLFNVMDSIHPGWGPQDRRKWSAEPRTGRGEIVEQAALKK